MSNKRDLLSLLLQRSQSQDGAAEPVRDRVDTNPAEPQVRISPPARIETSDGVRPSPPRQPLRARPAPQAAGVRHTTNNTDTNSAVVPNPSNVKAAPPRMHVESTREEPITLSQIANSPAHAAPGAKRRGMTPEMLSRIIIYPILFVAFVGAVVFAWQKFSPGSQGDISNSGSNGTNLNNTEQAELQNPAGSGPGDSNAEIDVNNPNASGGNENAASAGSIQNVTNNTHVIRAIAYSDSPDGLERANTTVSQLRQRGFPDARAVRLPKDKEATRFEIVVLLGSGESSRDSSLVQLRERLQTLPGFLSSQAKQRPFQDSFIMRQPDADRVPTSR
ncbi:MAG: hypothetical protein ACKVS6_13220 [Planctomycetota bacterium]